MWVKIFAEFTLSGMVFEIQAFLCFAIFVKKKIIFRVFDSDPDDSRKIQSKLDQDLLLLIYFLGRSNQ